MKVLFVCGLINSLLFFSYDNPLKGRWVSPPSRTGAVTSVVFTSDSTFEGFINKKPFTSGKYTYKDSVFTFTDTGCEGKRGIYKTIFFSNNDSLRFQVIEDSCTERKEGMSRLVFGKAL